MGIIGYEQLAKAAQAHDATAEQGGSDDAIIEAGLDPAQAWMFAEQRALRLVLVANGRADELKQIHTSGVLTPVSLSQAEQMQVELFKLAVMDGACISRRA